MRDELLRYAQVLISDDAMSCDLCLNSAAPDDFFNVEEVLEFINSSGVVYGINSDIIIDMVHNKVYDKFITVATGTPVTKGQNGYYSYTFNTSPNKKPRLREDGSVDYYNLNLIQCVSEGDLLAKYFEKVEGKSGRTVTGRELPVEKYKNLPPLRGKGFTTSEDFIEYYAAYDGKVELSMGGIMVTKISTIPGNVDLSVGNLDVKGDLEILGSVITGMVVKATGNITINGLVEAAHIHAGKNVLIKGGVLGGGKAKIEGGGNVFAQFIENAEVISGDCVQADSVINSIVTAYNDINVFGKTSSIIGGSLKANRTVRSGCIGSEGQILTRISVGVEDSVIASIKQKELMLHEEKEELQKIEKAMALIAKKPNESKEMLLLLTRTKIEKNASITELSHEITNMNQRMELAKKAEVVAEDKAYQGAIITIDGIVLKLEDDYEKIVFLKKGDKVLTKLYTED